MPVIVANTVFRCQANLNAIDTHHGYFTALALDGLTRNGLKLKSMIVAENTLIEESEVNDE